MDFLYFLVTDSKAWELHYHENFFNAQGGFLWGIIGALIIGVICACAFYFGCCNSKKTAKSANIGVWAISLLVCAVVAYFYADLGVIGDPATNSALLSDSFYEANNDYFIQQTRESNVTETVIKDLTQSKNEIKTNLDKGGDVRFEYNITTAILAIIFFVITSLIVKRFTYNGKTIPVKKP